MGIKLPLNLDPNEIVEVEEETLTSAEEDWSNPEHDWSNSESLR